MHEEEQQGQRHEQVKKLQGQKGKKERINLSVSVSIVALHSNSQPTPQLNSVVRISEQKPPTCTGRPIHMHGNVPPGHLNITYGQSTIADHASYQSIDFIACTDHWGGTDNDFLDLFTPDDFRIPHHCTSNKSFLPSPSVPEFPLCPGPGLIPHSLTVLF